MRYAAAAYLIYLGVRILLDRHDTGFEVRPAIMDVRCTFRLGIITELLNPTQDRAFPLAFLAQFINREAAGIPQFILFDPISVLLNSGVDIAIALLAGSQCGRTRRRMSLYPFSASAGCRDGQNRAAYRAPDVWKKTSRVSGFTAMFEQTGSG